MITNDPKSWANGLHRWKRRLRRFLSRHELFEPRVNKNKRYLKAGSWLRRFRKEKMPDPADIRVHVNDSLSDSSLADFVFDLASDEHRDAAEAHKQLVSKVYEQIKVSSAIIGGFAVFARWLTEGLQDSEKDLIGLFAIVALMCFLASLISGVSCARGLPYIPPFKVQHILDWAEPGKPTARLKILSAAYMHRRVEGNRYCNNWLSNRLTTGWQMVTVGFFFVIVSIAIRLFV